MLNGKRIEPDYKITLIQQVHSDNGAGMLAANGDGSYHHEVFNPDYVLNSKYPWTLF